MERLSEEDFINLLRFESLLSVDPPGLVDRPAITKFHDLVEPLLKTHPALSSLCQVYKQRLVFEFFVCRPRRSQAPLLLSSPNRRAGARPAAGSAVRHRKGKAIFHRHGGAHLAHGRAGRAARAARHPGGRGLRAAHAWRRAHSAGPSARSLPRPCSTTSPGFEPKRPRAPQYRIAFAVSQLAPGSDDFLATKERFDFARDFFFPSDAEQRSAEEAKWRVPSAQHPGRLDPANPFPQRLLPQTCLHSAAELAKVSNLSGKAGQAAARDLLARAWSPAGQPASCGFPELT